MPTEGRDDQKVETNEIRTVPTPPDAHHPPVFTTTGHTDALTLRLRS
jgi:hypothetical protein